MKKQINLIITLVIEITLIALVVVLLLTGMIGVFVPVLPGLVFVGLGVTIYFFLLKNKNNRITNFFHQYLLRIKNYFLDRFKNNEKFMRLIKAIKKKKEEKIKEEILKDGLILFGFNLALMLALFFVLTALAILTFLFNFSGIVLAFIPLVVIFLFAAACVIVWYRFGQILSQRFKKRKILYSALVVIISIIPSLLILSFLSLLVNLVATVSSLLSNIFIGVIFITILAVIFELLIVILGVVTEKK